MRIGIVVNDTSLNQAAFSAINGINSLSTNETNNYVLFYKEAGPICCKIAASCMPLDKMYHFDGALIATNIDLAFFMTKVYTPRIKLLYLFDLEWLRGSKNFIFNSTIYNHKNIKVIVPSKEYYDELYNYCGKKADAIIPQFNLIEIGKVIETCNLQ